METFAAGTTTRRLGARAGVLAHRAIERRAVELDGRDDEDAAGHGASLPLPPSTYTGASSARLARTPSSSCSNESANFLHALLLEHALTSS